MSKKCFANEHFGRYYPRRGFRTTIHLGLLVAVGVIAGCGSKEVPYDADAAQFTVVPVRGTVTLDGKPLRGAMVVFHPQDIGLNVATAVTDQQGEYVLPESEFEGVFPGPYNVTIRSSGVSKPVQKSSPKAQRTNRSEKGATEKEKPQAIPSRYSDVGQTELHIEITPGGPEEHNFSLTTSL